MSPARENTCTIKPVVAADRTETASTSTIAQSTTVIPAPLNGQRLARQKPVRLEILLLRALHHRIRQCRRGRFLVPVNALEIIPNILLVERRLRMSWRIA